MLLYVASVVVTEATGGHHLAGRRANLTPMRRLAVTCATAVGALLLAAAPALAHNEWEPATAAPGSTPQLRLKVEDERTDAGTTRVELIFPAPLTVAALPAVPAWTATVTDGEVGGS